MSLWTIYIFLGSVHMYSCSRLGRPIIGIYKSLTDTWMWKLGLRVHSSFSGNIYFKFLEFCLCSASSHHPRDVFFKERNTQDFSFGDIANIPESGLPFSRGNWSPSGGTARDSWGEDTPRPSPCPALSEACRSAYHGKTGNLFLLSSFRIIETHLLCEVVNN